MQPNRCTAISYNCKSLKRTIVTVQQLCETADVLALQETWLLPHDLAILGNIHADFAATGVSAVDTKKGVLRGRPYGGVAIMWRKNAFDSVSIIQCKSVRLCAIKCVVRDQTMLFFSVYMPTDNKKRKHEDRSELNIGVSTDVDHENLVEFTDCLSELSAIIEDCDVENVYMLGDFNAHPGELFHRVMLQFCVDQNWDCVDLDMLGDTPNTYTYISDSQDGCMRWLDHCLVTRSARQTVVEVSECNVWGYMV